MLCFSSGIHQLNSSNDDDDASTFAYVCDVEVEAADGEVGVLDLQRHCCLLFDAGRRARCFVSFIGRGNGQSVCLPFQNQKNENVKKAIQSVSHVSVLPRIVYGRLVEVGRS